MEMVQGAFQLGQVFERAAEGIFVINADRQLVHLNKACERITGYSGGELLGHQCRCEDPAECGDEQGRSIAARLCPGLSVFGGTSPAASARLQLNRSDGRTVWVETCYAPIQDDHGRVQYVLGILRDVSSEVAREQEWRETTKNLHADVERLQDDVRERYGISGLLSRSPLMETVFDRVRAACTNHSGVLISGESGVGKEAVARAIHDHGLQKDGPFVPLNCSSLPRDLIETELFGYVRASFTGARREFDGLFRAAEGGTIFLDEIDEMPLGTQAKVLRAIQDKRVCPVRSTAEAPIDVRVIAATNRSLSEVVASGKLRQDLYYCLNVIGIEVPALRKRLEDIPLLSQYFIDRLNEQSTRNVTDVEPATWSLLMDYDWPGNVRELENAVESTFAIGTGATLRANDLPGLVRSELPETGEQGIAMAGALDSILASVERRAILLALRNAKGKRSEAARTMKISRSRLYRRMDALKISPRERF